MFFILQAIGSGNYLQKYNGPGKQTVVTPDLQKAQLFKAVLENGELKVVDGLPADIGPDWIPRSVQVHLV